MGAWSELDTTIKAEFNFNDLDELINLPDDIGIYAPLKEAAKQMKKQFQDGAKRGVDEIAKRNISFQEKWINKNCKNPSGMLASSIGMTGSDYSITTGTRISHIYPMSVEYGADIYPVRAKALRFPAPKGWKGKVSKDGFVFLKEAHPKPHPFVKPAYDDTNKIAEKLMMLEINHAGAKY